MDYVECPNCGSHQGEWELSVPAYSGSVRARLFCSKCPFEDHLLELGKSEITELLNVLGPMLVQKLLVKDEVVDN